MSSVELMTIHCNFEDDLEHMEKGINDPITNLSLAVCKQSPKPILWELVLQNSL